MPPNTVYVGRPTIWGNPFMVSEYGARLAVFNYRNRLENYKRIGALDTALNISFLRGKDLACFCPLDQPCHADVLLEIANEREP